MTTKLDPIISEFETQEEADAYDAWFRAKVEKSLANASPSIPHDEAMRQVKEAIRKAAKRPA